MSEKTNVSTCVGSKLYFNWLVFFLSILENIESRIMNSNNNHCSMLKPSLERYNRLKALGSNQGTGQWTAPLPTPSFRLLGLLMRYSCYREIHYRTVAAAPPAQLEGKRGNTVKEALCKSSFKCYPGRNQIELRILSV